MRCGWWSKKRRVLEDGLLSWLFLVLGLAGRAVRLWTLFVIWVKLFTDEVLFKCCYICFWFQWNVVLVPAANNLTTGEVEQCNICLLSKIVIIISRLLLIERDALKEAVKWFWKFSILELSNKNWLIKLDKVTKLENFVLFEQRVWMRIVFGPCKDTKSFSLNCLNGRKIFRIWCPVDNWTKVKVAFK